MSTPTTSTTTAYARVLGVINEVYSPLIASAEAKVIRLQAEVAAGAADLRSAEEGLSAAVQQLSTAIAESDLGVAYAGIDGSGPMPQQWRAAYEALAAASQLVRAAGGRNRAALAELSSARSLLAELRGMREVEMSTPTNDPPEVQTVNASYKRRLACDEAMVVGLRTFLAQQAAERDQAFEERCAAEEQVVIAELRLVAAMQAFDAAEKVADPAEERVRAAKEALARAEARLEETRRCMVRDLARAYARSGEIPE
ncbi:hypothetical protein Q8F55_001553 [Vanrija albida]|uniref:Uncharacterized protein n=1 Tax=Vanrija albida TaxID=181172 RepID=A0ABR3QGD3_9TREE